MNLSPRLVTLLVFLGGLASGLVIMLAVQFSYIFFGPTGCEVYGEVLGCERTRYPYGTPRGQWQNQPEQTNPVTSTTTPDIVVPVARPTPKNPLIVPGAPVDLNSGIQQYLERYTLAPDYVSSTLSVNWVGPIKLDMEKTYAAMLDSDPVYGNKAPLIDPAYPDLAVYERGTVKEGEFKDWKFIIWMFTSDGIAEWTNSYYTILSPDGKTSYVLEQPYGTSWTSAYMAPAPFLSIQGIRPPVSLETSTGAKLYQLGGINFQVDVNIFCDKDACPGRKEVMVSKEGYKIFQSDDADCYIAYGNDGAAYRYASFPVDPAVYQPSPSIEASSIRWDAGIKVQAGIYISARYTGCQGMNSCLNVVSPDDFGTVNSLRVIGNTKDNSVIYSLKDPTSATSVKMLYDTWYLPSERTKPTIQEFLKRYPVPVFYVKNQLGEWLQYDTNQVSSGAECGKPVIYLYPEKTTDISVRLPSFINVTVSEPTYPVGGWKTTAQPNGALTMKDGSTHGSLYWEGTGVGYLPPKEGFIVKDGDVESFLKTTLAKYGLNEQESFDFREFWVPLMTGAPYYRVSFLTDEWSKAAPLYVSPAPKTSIRIFMDWRPISSPISMPEPKIVTPKRDGYTLVEWGGTLWK